MIENYVAFDFETASGKNPCSIGIVEFNNGKVINEYYSLINPKIEKFNPFTTRIHGIREVDVINEREFDEVWNEIEHFFKDKIVIAHNSSFDISVLNYSLERYNLEKLNINCYCTLQISRRLLELDNYKLNTIAKYYSLEQNNYHNALEDAFICGKIFSNLMLEAKDDEFFLEIRSYSINQISEPQIKVKAFQLSEECNELSIDLRFDFLLLFGIQTDKLKGQSIVVSGVFETLSRDELKKLIEDNGGKVSSSISSKTSFIVAGDAMGPSKKKKADDLNIIIINEYEFLQKIK